jgi:hypothetical protein
MMALETMYFGYAAKMYLFPPKYQHQKIKKQIILKTPSLGQT